MPYEQSSNTNPVESPNGNNTPTSDYTAAAVFLGQLKSQIDNAQKEQKSLESKIEETQTTQNNLVKEITREVKERISEDIKNLKDQQRDLKNDQIKMIETLSLFVALLTFVTSEVQLFKQNMSINGVAGFTLILLGALTFFVLLINYMLKDLPSSANESLVVLKGRKNSNSIVGIIPYLMSILLIILGTILITAPMDSTQSTVKPSIQPLEKFTFPNIPITITLTPSPISNY